MLCAYLIYKYLIMIYNNLFNMQAPRAWVPRPSDNYNDTQKIYLVHGIVSTAPAGYPSMDFINCEGMCVRYPTRNAFLRHTSLKYWAQS